MDKKDVTVGLTPYIMVLIGCAQGGECQPIATMPVAYQSEASCLDSRADIVAASAEPGYRRVIAECRPMTSAPRTVSARAVPTS